MTTMKLKPFDIELQDRAGYWEGAQRSLDLDAARAIAASLHYKLGVPIQVVTHRFMGTFVHYSIGPCKKNGVRWFMWTAVGVGVAVSLFAMWVSIYA